MYDGSFSYAKALVVIEKAAFTTNETMSRHWVHIWNLKTYGTADG